MVKVSVAVSAVMRDFSEEPTISRVKRSMTIARYSQTSSVPKCVMSDVRNLFGAVGMKHLSSRLSATGAQVSSPSSPGHAAYGRPIYRVRASALQPFVAGQNGSCRQFSLQLIVR